MTVFKKIIILFILSLLLSSCDDKVKSMPKKQEEYYNFRDEKYQDFYSRFMREVEKRNLNAITPNDSFERPFDKTYIRSVFGVDPNEEVHFKLNVEPVKLEHLKNIDNSYSFSNPEDVIKRYSYLFNKGDDQFEYELCDDLYYEKDLFCIKKLYFSTIEYHYFSSNNIKIDHINQHLSFYCYLEKNKSNCEMWNIPNHKYNIKVIISFSRPHQFFHIMPYVEKYFYEITGEHLWQTSLKEN